MTDRVFRRWPDECDVDRSKSAASVEPSQPGHDRRGAARVRLDFEVAVPVLVRAANGLQRGLVRNISEGGMLIEVLEPPAIGSEVDVTIAGVKGSEDAPEAVVLSGEVRHHVAWQYSATTGTRGLRGVGVRFVSRPASFSILGRVLH